MRVLPQKQTSRAAAIKNNTDRFMFAISFGVPAPQLPIPDSGFLLRRRSIAVWCEDGVGVESAEEGGAVFAGYLDLGVA
jgi:hypothetical protein